MRPVEGDEEFGGASGNGVGVGASGFRSSLLFLTTDLSSFFTPRPPRKTASRLRYSSASSVEDPSSLLGSSTSVSTSSSSAPYRFRRNAPKAAAVS